MCGGRRYIGAGAVTGGIQDYGVTAVGKEVFVQLVLASVGVAQWAQLV